MGQKIEGKYELADSKHTTAGPARYVLLGNRKSRIGLISAVTHNFCENYNKVTVEFRLLLRLGNKHSVDLRTILRALIKESAILSGAGEVYGHKARETLFV